MNNKERIKDYIKTNTERLIQNKNIDDNGLDAINIALDLNIDRANVSRELNDLWKEMVLIKIAGRPVFYLDYNVLHNNYPDCDIPSFIPKENKLSDYLNQKTYTSETLQKNVGLSDMIGANGSLRQQIENAKAAVSYPPYGINTLISGNSGTEKIRLAESMIEYAINNNIKKKGCPYILLDCRVASANVTRFETELFGIYDETDKEQNQKGILEKCTNGFLILEGIEYLPQSTFDLISSLLSKKSFTKINSNTYIPLKCMLIITTSTPIDDERLLPISSYTSSIVVLPDLDKRGIYEKIEIILSIFSSEAKNINKTIKVSKDVISCLSSKIYKQNINEIQNDIKYTCSKAYLDAINNEQITVSLFHLPTNIIEMSDSEYTKNSKMSSSMLLNAIKQDYFIFDKNGHSEGYDNFKKMPNDSARHLLSQFINGFNIDINSLESLEDYAKESIGVIKDCNDIQLNEFRKNIDKNIAKIVTSIIYKHPEYSILKRNEELLYGILLHITNSKDRITNNEKITYSPIISNKLYPKEYEVSKEIYTKLKEKYNTKVVDKEIDMLAIYLAISKQYLENNAPILVIAHGESVASQMVSYVKENSERKVEIDAIDFNSSMQLNDCMELACIKAHELNRGTGIIVFTDKEPLLTIHEHITKQTGIPCYSVNPLTLSSLLQLVENNNYMQSDINNLTVHNSFHNKNDDVGTTTFLQNLIDKVIINNCNFINPYKAIKILNDCLNTTLKLLNIPYSDEIAVKYICLCVNLLERVIKNQPWINNSTNKFISNNAKLMSSVEKGFETANNSFAIKIPQTELVYVSEIFLPYLN